MSTTGTTNTLPQTSTETQSDGLDLLSASLHSISIKEADSRMSLVDTPAAISKLVDELNKLPSNPPSLFVDIEGVNLCRHGSISILQLYVSTSQYTHLVDVHTLGEKAFSTAGEKGITLKDVLESPTIPKVFFDVRNDSDTLFSHFQVSLKGVHDLQLMELATRKFSKRNVNGLKRCIEQDAPMSYAEKSAWKSAKDKGLRLFAPELGGSYEVFNERPLADEIKAYCAQDVQFLPRLWSHYNNKMNARWREKVLKAGEDRVALSQTRDYNGKGRHMALAPSGWY